MVRTLRILLVEDSDLVRPITEEYLTELGHTSHAVSSAEQALEALQTNEFDVVLTDVRLPGMSGVALAKHCAEKRPSLAIVITSGYGDLSGQLFSTELRDRVFMLPKPFDMEAMERVLNEVAAQRPNG